MPFDLVDLGDAAPLMALMASGLTDSANMDLVERLDIVLNSDGDLVRLGSTLAGRDSTRASALVEDLAAHLSHEEVISSVKEVLAGIRQLDHSLGSGHAAAALRAHAMIAEALLTHSSDRNAKREVLQTLGEVHQLLGWIEFDRSDIKSFSRRIRPGSRLRGVCGR